MELTAIIAGLLLLTGGLVLLAGVAAHAWLAGHQELPAAVAHLAGRFRRATGRRGGIGGPRPGADLLVLTLVLGLAVVALSAIGLGTLVDDVTDGHGVAVVDHPVAGFVAAHRALALTSVMRAVSTSGGPAWMTVIALAGGLLLGVAWRSWAPAAALAVTDAGIVGLTIVFKAVLGRARPPLAQAVAAADGFGFPSGHAATAVAVCGVAAWLCSSRMRSWRRRTAAWVVAAMLAALVGISRVYLGVHWTTDVIGGWMFGALWLAVVVSGWTVFAPMRERPAN